MEPDGQGRTCVDNLSGKQIVQRDVAMDGIKRGYVCPAWRCKRNALPKYN